MSFPKYLAYKDSGVEWLGEVPEHWCVHPLKRAIERIESGTSVNAADFPAEPGSLGVLKTSCVYTGKFDWAENKTVDDEDLSRVSCPLRKDTLIVSRMNTPDLVGATGLVTEAPNGIFLPDRLWQVYFLENHSPEFLFYFTKSREYREQVKMACSGTSASMQNLGQDDFRSLLFAEPPKREQHQIARFLAHETARIDALIEEQQRLIELLKEKRQAVISHAVTKGLDPSVAMKDSGLEWLGEVPAHWSTLQVGRVCRKVSDGPHFSPDYVDEGVLFLSARNIAVDGWHLEDAKFISEEDYLEFCRRIIPEKGDVLYTKGGTTGIARVVDLDERFQVWVHVAVLKLDRVLVDPYYMAFSLNSAGCYEQSQLHTRGATNQDLGLTRMTKIWFALPPLEEQTKICNFLNQELGNIDSLSSEATTVMELLTERRSALISAAVTGKIDLRGWQPPTSTPTSIREQETA